MTIFPSISPLNLFGLGGLNPISGSLSATASSTSLFSGASTIVELSGLGQLLSAVSTFQNQLSVLRPGSPDSGVGRNLDNDFGSLVLQTQFFVDSLNGLQMNLNGLGGLFNVFGASSSTTQFGNRLLERLDATFDNGDSALTRLSDLGIAFQTSPIPAFGGGLSIDIDALQAAFESDPDGAFSLLARAVEEFGALAEEVTSPNNRNSSLLTSQLQFSALQLSLNLFDEQSNSTRNGLLGLTDLLTLASLGQADSNAQARLVVAMNEFSLVSSLLR